MEGSLYGKEKDFCLWKGAHMVSGLGHCWTREAGRLLQISSGSVVDGPPKLDLLCRQAIMYSVRGSLVVQGELEWNQKQERLKDPYNLIPSGALDGIPAIRINLLRKLLSGKCKK